MTARNDHTGDLIKSKPNSKAYRDNYDRIFGAGSCDKPVEKVGPLDHIPDGSSYICVADSEGQGLSWRAAFGDFNPFWPHCKCERPGHCERRAEQETPAISRR
jgi:hypothetical protein